MSGWSLLRKKKLTVSGSSGAGSQAGSRAEPEPPQKLVKPPPRGLEGTNFEGLAGFDELRRYVKSGNEFCKELSSIMQERSDLEMIYAKGLTKISTRLQKLAATCIGTLSQAWTGVATATEQQAELHKSLSTSLIEDVHKPLKTLSESVHKSRKPIEGFVDRAMRNVVDKRSEEAKCKRNAFSLARDVEKLNDQSLDARAGKGKMSEKDSSKLDKKSKVCEESLRKADKDYCEACVRAEVSRQEWQFAVHKGAFQLYRIEETRLAQLRELLNIYHNHISLISPQIQKLHQTLSDCIMAVDTEADIKQVRETKCPDLSQTDQILLECYAEDLSMKMNSDRRTHSLGVYSYFVQMDIDKEKKGQEGVEKLLEVYQQKPHFADAQAQEDVKQKLISGEAMMNFLRASLEKLQAASALASGQAPQAQHFSEFIKKSKDKLGQPVTILRIPEHARKQQLAQLQDYQNVVVPASRAPPVGEQRFSYSDTEFDNHESDEFDSIDSPVAAQCRSIYDYTAVRQDEMNIKEGDVITVVYKEDSGWWMGELHGRRGLFPATYVEEI